MERTVDQSLFNNWIEDHGPYGHEKLSVKAEVSYPTIGEIRRGYVPTKHIRKRLAEAMGYTEDDLFPLVDAREQAS